MLTLFRKWFGQTIDGLISDITNKVEQLHAVAELHAAEESVKAKIAADAKAAQAFAEKEYDRAKAIAAKLTALVS